MTDIGNIGWTFAQLRPRLHPLASENAAILNNATLGIEVTEPDLARQCDLGNIDPQHSLSGPEGMTAIDMALGWEPLPDKGAYLVTIRPDADAVGAMAVLALRATGWSADSTALERIATISRWDRFDHGEWQSWRRHNLPLPNPATASQLGGAPIALRAVSALAMDHAVELAHRVYGLAKWLQGGPPPYSGIVKAAQFHEALLADWNTGRIKVELCAQGRIAQVKSDGPNGLIMGYRYAPVIVAQADLSTGRKFTVAQFSKGWLNMAELLKELTYREPGWGGSRTIIGSPQGTASILRMHDIVQLVEDNLRPPK